MVKLRFSRSAGANRKMGRWRKRGKSRTVAIPEGATRCPNRSRWNKYNRKCYKKKYRKWAQRIPCNQQDPPWRSRRCKNGYGPTK